MKPEKQLRSARAMRVGTYSVVISLVAIAIAILVNVLASKLPSQMTRIDVTDSGLYTLSEQTEQIAKSLDTDVTIYLVAETGAEDATLLELLDRYADLSSHIKVVRKDPVLYPSFLSQYTDQPDTVAANSLVVESALRSTIVPNSDIYHYTYSTYYYYSYVSDTQFNGESALTTAIDYVTTSHLPTIYQMTGHGETEVTEQLAASIAGDNMELKSLSLLSVDAIPDDADCVLLNAPQVDLSADEAEMLAAYLEAGGSMLLVTDYTALNLPNLLSVTETYGLTAEPGLILEGNSANCYRYRNYLLPNVENTAITSAIYEGKYLVFLPNAHGIRATDNVRSSLELTTLLSTSKDAYAKPNLDETGTGEKQDGDTDGPFAVAMSASETHNGVTTQLVWIGAPSVMAADTDAAVSGTNSDLILATFGWMCERENSISIHTKSMNTEYLTVDDASATLWSLVFIVAIPLVLVIAAVTILVRRRKR